MNLSLGINRTASSPLSTPLIAFLGSIKYLSALSAAPSSPHLIKRIMSMNALCFFGIKGANTLTSKDIFSVRHEFEVFWINTRAIVTQVVNFFRHLVYPFFYESVFPLIEQSMSFIAMTSPVYSPVSIAKIATRPIPAFCNWVNLDVFENSISFLLRKHIESLTQKLAYSENKRLDKLSSKEY
jgi:hypothetical protein